MAAPIELKQELSALLDKAWDAIIADQMKIGEIYFKRFPVGAGEFKVKAMWDGRKLHLEVHKRR